MKSIAESKLNAWAISCLLAFFLLLSFGSPQVIASEVQQDGVEVTGVVTDSETGEALPGVTVVVTGTSKGTITDIDGVYTLSAPADADLTFSFVGYLSETVAINSSSKIDVAMVADIIGLDEVIVTGYGVQRKSDITGSIASVGSEEINAVPIAGVDQALQGLAAGVNVIPVSGRPGEDAVIQIRGISSVNGVEPLIIIDGAPGNLSDVAPSDVASIEILKDASSAAIYGDSGGNGVILVTTKKGKSGKLVTNFNMYEGIEMVVDRIDLMNTDQWLGVVEEMRADVEAYTSNRDTFGYYDWQDIMFQPALTQNYDLSASGGNDVSTFMLSAAYNNQTGIIKSSNFERFTFRLNSEHKLTNRITVDEKISYINRTTFGLPPWQWNAYYDGPIRNGLIMPPNVPDYADDGTWGISEYARVNPLAQLDMVDRISKENNFNANLGVKLELFKGFSFTSRIAGGFGFWDNKEYQDAYFSSIYDFRNDNEVKIIAAMGKRLGYTAQELLQYDFSINGVHNVSLLGGIEFNRDWGYDYNGERFMAPNTPAYLQYFSQSSDLESISQIIGGSAYENRGFAYLGRLNYDYKGKYLLTSNMRYSGRSSFGPDFRWGAFPSFSVGWKFSEEEFVKDMDLFSFGKLRFGYGLVGTYAKSGYPYLSIVRQPETFGYPFNNLTSSPGAAPVQIANPEIHWETIKMSNFGVDLAFLNNRLTVTAEYYNRINEDMLMLQNVPYIVGTYTLGAAFEIDNTSPEVNIGSVKNSGFELVVGYKDQIGDLKYTINANMSTIKNEVLELATDSLSSGGVHNVAPITMTRIGGSISEFWGYETDGLYTLDDCQRDANGDFITDARGRYRVINQPMVINDNGDTTLAQPTAQPGDFRWIDVNGDGKVLTVDDKVMLGSPIPKLTYGFSINLEWKGIDMAAQFTGTYGNKIFNGTKQYLYYYQDETNRHADFADRYVVNDVYKNDIYTGEPVLVLEENRDTDIPRNFSVNYVNPSDFFIEDGSYLRLRNLTLGYTLPKSVTNLIKVERLRIYVGGRNLKTWTKYTGINPEVGEGSILAMGIDASIYPVTKMFLGGLNITF
ncbi:MAG: TonB-dependent receptor [Bacteroidales bacterium]|nr:TonB-dependent receptor [Bacteroidales bacterium]